MKTRLRQNLPFETPRHSYSAFTSFFPPRNSLLLCLEEMSVGVKG